MELILVGIYCFFVWLIFIKFKLLPWTTPWKVAVAIFPVVALATTLALLNIFAPTTVDVRVVKYVVPIVSQVRGRVIEVPVENNRPVKKGDVLFRIDPAPYESEVNALEAQLVSNEAKVGAALARINEMQARLPDAVVERAATRRTTQPGDEQCGRFAGLARPRQKTCRTEHGACRRRRREPVRPGAGADQRQRAHRANRRRTCRRATGEGEVVRPGQGRLRRHRRRQGADRHRAGGGALLAGDGRDDARPARERPLEPESDNRRGARQRHDGERDAAAGVLRRRHAVQRGDDLRRQRVPGVRDVQPERAAPGRGGKRSRDHARQLPGPHRQGARGLDHLGSGARAGRRVRQSPADDVQPASWSIPGEARGRRA